MANVIGWLVPRPNSAPATQTTLLPDNSLLSIRVSSSSYLSSQLGLGAPENAIELSFDRLPKNHGRYVLGSDPKVCDIVLPSLPHISAQHCSLGFDSQCRLTLDDFSECGTQVWYGWESNGDRTNYTWTLDSQSPQSIDIQGVKFQIIMNQQADWAAFKTKVDSMYQASVVTPIDTAVKKLSPSPGGCFTALPARQHVVVSAEVYVWDLERPWEPMVKAAA